MVQPDPAASDDVANDNRPALARHVPIIGVIAGDGQVIITDTTWSPTPFPNDPREA